jgi:hypothetical protein
MASIFTIDNVLDFSEKINLDELYEKKKQHDLNTLALFNKILNRIHIRIKTTSRQKIDEPFCWFVVPEIILGVPKYDQAACIAYVIDKLKENGFAVRYIHPNTLFICWHHFVPSYVRNEWKKRTGIAIDENGQRVVEEENGNQDRKGSISNGGSNGGSNAISNANNPFNLFSSSANKAAKADPNKQQKKYTPIQSYKPRGNLIYEDNVLDSLEKKFS